MIITSLLFSCVADTYILLIVNWLELKLHACTFIDSPLQHSHAEVPTTNFAYCYMNGDV